MARTYESAILVHAYLYEFQGAQVSIEVQSQLYHMEMFARSSTSQPCFTRISEAENSLVMVFLHFPPKEPCPRNG